jgi:hypothetical protein
MTIAAVWNMTPCRLVIAILLIGYPEDGGGELLGNVGTYITIYTMSYSRKV